MYKNKCTFFHPGGLAHSALHAAATGLCLISTNVSDILGTMIVASEFIAHYIIDWGKMNINARFNLTPMNSENFWRLLGLDQWLHSMTYVAIVWAAF